MFWGVLHELNKDFFELTKDDDDFDEVEMLISHLTIHCMNDTRYKNNGRLPAFRSYMFAKKLSEICPNIKDVIVSVPVNSSENIVDNASWLSDSKFRASFIDAGYTLEKTIYDKKCLNNKYKDAERVSEEFPAEYAKGTAYIVGNYWFKR